MNWDDLRFFLAAVRAGTYSGAAEQLGVNRTTVARRIIALEQRLGRTLTIFEGNTYRLTEAGSELYRQAKELEGVIDKLETRLGLEEEALSGQLRIAAPLGLGPEFMPQLAAFSAAFPQVRWELINSLDPVASLNDRKADVALAVSNYCPGHIKGEYIGKLSRAIYGSRQYLKRIPARAELAKHHWIAWGKDLSQSEAAKWMAGNLPRDVYKPAEVNSWHALKQAVLAGLGVAHLWCFLADEQRELVAIRRPEPELGMGLWLMRPGDFPANARVRAFEQSLAPALKKRILAAGSSR